METDKILINLKDAANDTTFETLEKENKYKTRLDGYGHPNPKMYFLETSNIVYLDMRCFIYN